jgi:hypothetical protein
MTKADVAERIRTGSQEGSGKGNDSEGKRRRRILTTSGGSSAERRRAIGILRASTSGGDMKAGDTVEFRIGSASIG